MEIGVYNVCFSVKSLVNETYYKSNTKCDIDILNFQETFKIMSNIFVYDIIKLKIRAKFRFPLFLAFQLFWVRQLVPTFAQRLHIRCLTRCWLCLCLFLQCCHTYQMFLEEGFSYWNIFWKYYFNSLVVTIFQNQNLFY